MFNITLILRVDLKMDMIRMGDSKGEKRANPQGKVTMDGIFSPKAFKMSLTKSLNTPTYTDLI